MVSLPRDKFRFGWIASLLFLGVVLAGYRARATDVFLSSARVADLRTRVAQRVEPTYTAYLVLKKDADAALDSSPQAPAAWYVPRFYVDPAAHQKAKRPLAIDADQAYGLALIYRMTGDEKYAAAAVRLLNGWTTTLKSFSRQDDSPLTFSYNFPAFIFAAAPLADSKAWTPAAQQAFKNFVRTKALPMNTMDRENNWGNWGLVLVFAGAAYLQDHALLAQATARWKHFIDTQIAPDGHLPLEVTRNNGVGEHGLWYSNFCLMPQTVAAEIARVNGVDLYNYRSATGTSLRLAYERIVPWVANPRTFPYYHGTDPKGQLATESVSYWEILNARWPQPQAAAILAAKRPMTTGFSSPYLTFTHGDLLKD
jgi:hypothetical protein